eukprot:TRINITY_DN15338_c0_g1_i1.p2 TRINITY_DN15338_c0_g1~~TRINITY_DN15338_c0_g1_i1.p2  ORF type:complete len:109 (-),score=39.02 TRINITY_DN15338_c0_g1_i1:179-505(-)
MAMHMPQSYGKQRVNVLSHEEWWQAIIAGIDFSAYDTDVDAANEVARVQRVNALSHEEWQALTAGMDFSEFDTGVHADGEVAKVQRVNAVSPQEWKTLLTGMDFSKYD